METPLPRKVAFVLVAIVLANLALDFGLWYSVRLGADELEWVFVPLIGIGVLPGQMLLLAVWISFSTDRWHWRFGVPPILASSAAVACVLGVGGDPAVLAVTALLPQILLWSLVALLMPLRRVRGWRLMRSNAAPPAERGRFRVIDLLIWMAVIGVPLALLRVLITTEEGRVIGLVAMLALTVFPVLWLAALAAFAPRGWRQSWFYLAATPLYVAVTTAIATHYFFYLVYDAFWWPRPGWALLLYGVAIFSAYCIVSALVVWLNCRALRKLGYRLIRPAWQRSKTGDETPLERPIEAVT